ncbi:MAG: hypothetical protein M1837_002247 [Sclerophora amabilis]|nr:MAG: hypothetical protein M1837_002247 [Sclerophora amabilis]
MAPRAGEVTPDTALPNLQRSSTLATSPNSIASSNLLHPTESDNPRLRKASSPYASAQSPGVPNLTSIASAGLQASPSSKSPKLVEPLSPRYSPSPLTAAAAMAEERRMARERDEREQARHHSENPAKTALGALLGSSTGMSRPQDAPNAPTATTAMSEGMAVAANAINVHDPMQVDEHPQTSPISMSSLGSFHSTSPAAIASSSIALSPGALSTRSSGDRDGPESQQLTPTQPDRTGNEDKSANRALTFPGPLPTNSAGDESRNLPRGMSLPMPGYSESSPRSMSSSKKHKCPYCSTDFTRHHNLKSHLLTHSHEKPFVCQTCSLRFRRLHDLKRHTKLHTGERPHICPKCGRRFARGDALARHNKGQGGCAGRRASVGSYGEDDYGEGSSDPTQGRNGAGGDDSMDGLMYAGGGSQDPDRLGGDVDSGDEPTGSSLPSIKAHNPIEGPDIEHGHRPSNRSVFHAQHHPSTYPPTANRGGSRSGSLMPPAPNHGGGFEASSPTHPAGVGSVSSNVTMGNTSQPLGANPPSVFAQGGMTESPKPLSPAGAASHQLGHGESGSIHRHRSPSLTQQLHQQQYGRAGGGRTPPPMNLPPPPPGNANPPQLPSLPGLAPPESRYTLASQSTSTNHNPPYSGPAGHAAAPQRQGSGGATPSSVISQSGGAPPGGISAAGSSSSHGQGSGEGSNNLFASGSDSLWLYIRSLEERVNKLSDEVTNLRSQVATQDQQNGVEPRP